MTVAAAQRFTKARPCPVCGGGENMPRGKGRRCSGFISSDGRYAHCTREEHAGALAPEANTEPTSWAHLLEGDCDCGVSHGDADNGAGPLGRELEAYRYVDERGGALFEVVRFEPKDFRQRRPGGAWGIAGVRRVLYRLPRVVAAIAAGETILVVEGERDVHRLEDEGLVATCNPMGAGKWSPDYTAQLLGAREVVVVADHDGPGVAHARAVAAELERAGIPVRAVMPPTAGHDVSAHLDDLGELDELVPLDEAEPEAEPDDETFRLEPVDWQELAAAGVPELEYLDEPFLPARKRIWGVGPAESGKSIWAAAKAAALTRAGAVVVYVSQENGLEEEARRFLRLRPDLERLRLFVDQGLDLTLEEHRAALLVVSQGAALVVLDTLTACWSGDEDANRELGEFDRDVMKPLVALGASALVLDHTGNPQPNVRRRGVSAPRGASSKGQKTDFLLEFTSTGDGSFRLERGKKRGTHGKEPRGYLVVDAPDGTLELVESELVDDERDLIAELDELMTDGEWWTVNALRKPKRLGGVGADPAAIKDALADNRFESADGPAIRKRKGSTYYRLARSVVASATHHDATTLPVDTRSVVAASSLKETTQRYDTSSDPSQASDDASGDEDDSLAESARRDTLEAAGETCRRCGKSFRRGRGNKGDLCADCARTEGA